MEKERSPESEVAAEAQVSSQAGAALVGQLPGEFAAAIQSASPEAVAQLLGAHPQLTDPIFWTVQTLRGNGFAQQVLAIGPTAPPQHQEEVPVETEAATTDRPAPAPAPHQPTKTEVGRMNAAWNQMSRMPTDRDHPWSAVRLPPEVVSIIDRYWRESMKNGLEHGGKLSRTKILGRTKTTDAPAYDAGEIDPSTVELGHLEDQIGIIHTHPEPDAPEHHSCFSWEDIWNFMGSGQNVSILRSGDVTYMLSRTKQSEALYDKLAPDHEAENTLQPKLIKTYNDAFDATQDGEGRNDAKSGFGARWAEAGERATFAVAQQYGLLFYKGQGSDLQLVTKPPAQITNKDTYDDFVTHERRSPEP